MRNVHVLLLALVLGSSSQALAQDDAAGASGSAAAGTDAAGGGDAAAGGEESSVDKVNEPVKEATNEVQEEMKMKDAQTGYGSAGCGLGSLLFQPGNGFTQVFAATTNGTSLNQSFGITSGTSNCDAAGYQPGSTAAFIQTNRSALAKDISRGKGATIAGLSDLAGCADSKAVGKKLQKNFGQIFPAASISDREVSESVVRVLKSDESLSCTNLT
jgi:hypothetical protein